MALAPFLPIIGKVVDRIFPDKQAAADAKLKLFELEQQGQLKQLDADVQLAVGQMAVNQEEAKHDSIFVAGWRPFVGWVCGVALAYHFILLPIMTFVAFVSEVDVAQLPEFDFSQLSSILLGMLGLGIMRTVEKKGGVARKGLNLKD